MGRKRRSGPDLDKVSFMLLHELNQQVEDVGARHKWSTSYTLRYLIKPSDGLNGSAENECEQSLRVTSIVGDSI
jgi:hypothetical protein